MRRIVPVVLGVALLLGWASTASATIIFTLGNHPQPDEENILFSGSETGGTITGTTNKTGVDVSFSSLTGQILYQKAKGQALIENAADPGNALLNSLYIAIEPGYAFGDFIMNPLNGIGKATVTVFSVTGASYSYDLGNGENFLTIVASADDLMTAIQIVMDDPADGFKMFKQPRISGVCAVADCGGDDISVPEPASFALLGLGLAAGASRVRRRPSAQ